MNEFVKIKDLKRDFFQEGLLYSNPCRGLWNIVHLATQVPGSHQIYVCPTSCLRGVVLTTAEMGVLDRLSTITVGEDNILDGDLEERILYGTRKILNTLNRKPTVVFIFTSCIHHFMAANYQRVYKILRQEYPTISFIDAYMDPIMRKKTPPLPCLQRQIYRVLQPTNSKKNQCNFIDNWFYPENNDLYDYLIEHGVQVNDLSQQNSYSSYLEMNQSAVNFSFHRFGKLACNDMFYRLKQNYLFLPNVFDYEQIDKSIEQACEYMHIPKKSMHQKEHERKSTENTINHLRELLKDTMISIDQSAIEYPLSLALFLEKHDIKVHSLFLDALLEDEDTLNQLIAYNPNIKIYSIESCAMRQMHRESSNIVAIGQQAAFFLNTPYFVDIIFQAGMYGYKGIRYLCTLIEEAYSDSKDIQMTVSHKGWRCIARE